MAGVATQEDWGSLIRSLNIRLLGETIQGLPTPHDEETLDETELENWNARFVDGTQLVMPMPVAPVSLNVICRPNRTLPVGGSPPPMYLTSTSVPAYVRLHILSKLLLAFQAGTLIEPGDSFVMATMRRIEEEWAHVEDQGPPEMSAVLKHLLPKRSQLHVLEADETVPLALTPGNGIRKKGSSHRSDDRSDEQVKQALLSMRQDAKFKTILDMRKKLPASNAESHLLNLLKQNQCVVVVGETGCGKTTQRKHKIFDICIKI